MNLNANLVLVLSKNLSKDYIHIVNTIKWKRLIKKQLFLVPLPQFLSLMAIISNDF